MIQTQYLEPLLQAKVYLNIVLRNRLFSAQRKVENKYSTHGYKEVFSSLTIDAKKVVSRRRFEQF